MRLVDTTKERNIKCEHCLYWQKYTSHDYVCQNCNSDKYSIKTNYYNKCEAFEWATYIKNQLMMRK